MTPEFSRGRMRLRFVKVGGSAAAFEWGIIASPRRRCRGTSVVDVITVREGTWHCARRQTVKPEWCHPVNRLTVPTGVINNLARVGAITEAERTTIITENALTMADALNEAWRISPRKAAGSRTHHNIGRGRLAQEHYRLIR